MIASYKKKASIGIVSSLLLYAGIIIYTFSNLQKITFESKDGNQLLNLLGYISTGLLIWGCYNFAKGKGYSSWLALLGLLNILGVAVLLALPDKRKVSK